MSSQINSFDLAPILIQTGYGIPDHISPLGSEYTDLYTAFKYYNTNGLSHWVQYIDSSFSGGTGGGTFTGGTVTGSTYFLNGITATTISATTYYNLPIDVTITGGTYSDGTAIFSNNIGGTFSVSGFNTSTGNGETFTGGTVTGSTSFTNGLSANTISATTYLNLPTDIRVTGSSLNPATYDFTLIRNDGVTITSNLGLLATDMTVTGGTYNINTGIVTFTNNTGGTFNVSGFSSGMTDTFVTGGTYSAGTAVFNNNKGIKFNVTGFTNINSLNGLTANTQTFQTGTAGINFTINSTGSTHTFNLPDASTTARGVVTVNDQQFSGLKNFTDNIIVNGIRVWRGTNNSATNIGIGLDTLIDNTGNQNTVLGYQSASPVGITSGSFITAVGYQSLKNIPGNNNTAVGHTSGFLLTGGSQNTFIGSQAGGIVGQLTNVTNSSAIGYQAITTKNNQIVLGNSAVTETVLNGKIQIDTPTTSAALYDILTRNTTSGLIEKVLSTSIQEKITIGPISLIANASGASLSNGVLTLHAANATSGGVITTGTQIFGGAKTFINGLTANTISATTYYNLPRDIRVTGGTYSTGTTTFTNNTGGTYNVSGYTYIPHLGYDNLNSTIWNYGFGGNVNNISFGENSLISNTIGEYNTAFGSGVLTGNTIGNDNTGIGNYALNSNITGDYNTGIGSSALQYNTYGVQNFAIGAYSLYSNTTGSYNTGIGVSALENNIVGERNISIGGFSLYQNIGSRNIAIGFFAGSATLGDDNILFGSNSNNLTDGLVSGSNNTIIGTSVSGIINGSNNTIFGKPTGLSSTTSNNIVIADGSGNIRFRDNNINTILPRLAGSGNRMVIVGPNGELSAITITNTTFTGGTVNGSTIFTNGLTANTISATSINKVDYLIFNTGTTSAATVAGTVYFDNTEKALSYNTSINQGVTVNLGQQNYLRVFNNSGLDIQKGKGIELLSSYSGLPAIQLAVNRHYNDRDVVGVSAEIIPNNSEGIVLTYGIISNITVTGASIGSLVYASDTNPGEFKNATEFLNFPLTARTNAIGYIIQTGTTTGKLFVNPVNENNNLSLTDLQRNILEGNVISTGVFSFGGISLASSSTFNVGPAEGWIVDNTSNPLLPDVFYVKYTGQTNIPSLYYSSATQTYLLLTSAGTLTQQTTYPTPQQRRQSIYLAKMGHGNRTSLINAFNEPDFEISPISQIRDIFTPIKLINDGVYPSPNTDLTFNTSSGILWGLGIGFATDVLNPSSITISGNSPTTFQYRTQTGGTASNRTTIDPAKYDLNGTITTIGSPAKQATNQRIYLLQNGQIRIQYGQTKYADLTAAIAAVNTEAFTTFSNFRDNAVLIAILSVKSDATLLSDVAQAKITFASKFGESVGGTGGVSTTNLQQAYNNSSNPEIVINSTLGGLSIENGTGNADNVTKLLEGLNAAGNATSFIRADGDISGTTLQTNGFTANSGGLTATTISGNSLILSSSASTINLNNPNQQQIRFFSGGTGAPTYNTYSAGAKIILSDNIDSISSGYAIGVDLGSLWYGADLAGNGHDWYAGTRKLMSLASSSGLELVGLGGPGTTTMTISGTSLLGSKGGVGYIDFLKVVNNFSGATNPNKWFRVNQTGAIEIINSTYTATTLSIADNGIITISSPASVTSNSATNNALNIGSKGQLFDDGNFHIHSSSGSVWINSLDGNPIRLGTQTNTGNSTVIVDTTTVGHSFFTKVQSGFNVAFGTEITMDNLKVRINGTGGAGGLVQAGSVSGSFAAYTTLIGNVAGAALQGDTNSGGITFTTTYQNISGAQKTLSAGGDTTTLHLIDTTNSRIYRITAIHCQGTTGGYISIERMS